MTLYFNDMEVGDRREVGGYTFTREEIIEFGRRFDPQPFHVDEAAEWRSPYGGLIASGWHTVAACMRIVVTSLLGPESGRLGSPGADEIRWRKPVRPGDTLSVPTEVIEKRPSSSKPDAPASSPRLWRWNMRPASAASSSPVRTGTRSRVPSSPTCAVTPSPCESRDRKAPRQSAVHAAYGKEFAKTGHLEPRIHRWLPRTNLPGRRPVMFQTKETP